MPEKKIWTIGHSTRSAEEFISILEHYKIQLLADIRRFPGSKRYPHFNKEALQKLLKEHRITYKHFEALGGRRTPNKDSKNTGWRLAAFRGYADYMETSEFKEAVHQLEKEAAETPTAYMCSEAVWWSCHRSLVSDHLKARGWTVIHIMDSKNSQEHPYTKPARIVNGELSYESAEPKLF